jgi:hypothetical protein
MTKVVMLNSNSLPIFAHSKCNMSNLSNFLTISLTTLSLLNCTAFVSLKPASAEGIYLDKTCNLNQRLSQIEKFFVFYKSEFRTNNQSYWLSAARYQDGAAILCISRPYFKQAKLVKEIPIGFISTITKDLSRNGVFLVTVREGNGRNVPITVYRLDVINPNKPLVSKQHTNR